MSWPDLVLLYSETLIIIMQVGFKPSEFPTFAVYFTCTIQHASKNSSNWIIFFPAQLKVQEQNEKFRLTIFGKKKLRYFLVESFNKTQVSQFNRSSNDINNIESYTLTVLIATIEVFMLQCCALLIEHVWKCQCCGNVIYIREFIRRSPQEIVEVNKFPTNFWIKYRN